MIWIRISYNTELFFIQPLLRIGQKIVQNLVGFFGVWDQLVFCFRDLLAFNQKCPGWCTWMYHRRFINLLFSFFSLRRSIMQTVYYLTRKRGQYTTNTVPWGFIWLNSLVKISLIRLWLCNQNGSNVASCQSFVSLAIASVSHALLILYN